MKQLWMFFLCFALFLAGCQTETPPVVLPVIETPAATAVVFTPSPEAAPTETPVPGRVWLVGSVPNAALQQMAEALAGQSGLALEARPDLQTGLEAGVQVVLVWGQPAGLEAAVIAAPQVPFVLFDGGEGLPQAGNVWRVRSRPEDALFAAGYLTSILAPDWRSAALLPQDAGLGAQGSEVFTNGARYWCGRCAPTYGPVVLFPLTASLPSGSAPSAWLTAFDVLHEKRIEVVYVSPQAVSDELLQGLAARGVVVVGGAPPPADGSDIWAASVFADAPGTLQRIWPDVMSGQPGQEVLVDLQVSHVNEQLLSPGRLERLQAVIADLNEGLIFPFSISPQP